MYFQAGTVKDGLTPLLKNLPTHMPVKKIKITDFNLAKFNDPGQTKNFYVYEGSLTSGSKKECILLIIVIFFRMLIWMLSISI